MPDHAVDNIRGLNTRLKWDGAAVGRGFELVELFQYVMIRTRLLGMGHAVTAGLAGPEPYIALGNVVGTPEVPVPGIARTFIAHTLARMTSPSPQMARTSITTGSSKSGRGPMTGPTIVPKPPPGTFLCSQPHGRSACH
jgi:hypothetical protein